MRGGSSGSPIYDANFRQVGTCCCGFSSTCGSQVIQYGRLGKFYNTRNLHQWLDPNGKASGVWDGMYSFEPEAIVYNGTGTNPSAYTSTLPALGSPWTATVDASGVPGASFTMILGYAASGSTIVPQGEALVDLSSPRLFTISAPVVGGTSTHNAVLPNDPSLARRVAFTQAVIVGATAQLTNGVKLRLN